MGEYILLTGDWPFPRQTKLGVLEDLFYCRYTDLKGWIDAGRAARSDGNNEPAHYLMGAHRFRFPFPDEDGIEAARLATYAAEYDRGVLIPYPRALLGDIEHNQAYAEIRPRDGRPLPLRASMKVMCPLDAQHDQASRPRVEVFTEDAYIEDAYIDRGPWVELVQQRPIEGALWAVLRCPWCLARWRVTRSMAQWIADNAQDAAPELDLGETLRRMLAGYDGLPGGA